MAVNKKDKFKRFVSLHKKDIIIVSLILVAVTVAVVAFSVGFTSISNKEEGVYEVEVERDEDLSGYQKDFTFFYYFEGSSSEINSKQKALSELYSNHLKVSYASFNSSIHVNNYTNIYDINAHIGEEMMVSEFLYGYIKRAYEYSLIYDNYSLFAAPYYQYWNNMFTKDQDYQSLYDPSKNEENRLYLQHLNDILLDESNYSITFNEERHSIKVDISQAYKDFIANESFIDDIFPVISINILEDSFTLDYLQGVLENNGYDKGYISNLDGEFIVLKQMPDVYAYLYDKQDNNIYLYGSMHFENNFYWSQNRKYEITKRNISPFYSVKVDGEEIYRSRYIDISTGYPNDYLITSTVYAPEGGIDLSILVNNELLKGYDLSQVKDIYQNYCDKVGLVFTIKNTPKEAYCSTKNKDYVTIYENLQYNVNII